MEKIKIKIGDIVKAKFGTVVFGVTKTDGTQENSNFDIYGIVTDIMPDERNKEDEIEMKFFFDAKSSYRYNPDEWEVMYSTNLIKAPVIPTPEQIREEFMNDGINMSEFLASVPADGLNLEQAFELYIGARKWADADRFFVDKDEGELEELEF
ncbi:hypothetical protein [Dysgonomonas sp. GY617]|uniref:hypothetical protein n=1 Tax=Dysgonomonas sp. GY617 TaxID=2780420 RepID=UPI001F552229|nr:hypothetical protein [Dysgonomonas sp. GY617]